MSEEKPLKVALAGVAYDLKCDQRKADFEAAFCYVLGRMTPHFLHLVERKHATLIDVGRNRRMTALLSEGVDVALWMDSDTWLAMESIPYLIRALSLLGGATILACPYVLRDGSSSLWSGGKQETYQSTVESLGDGLRRLSGAGAGIWVQNVAWYRDNWPKSPWFLTRHRGHGLDHEGEDLWHCRQLIKRGGQVHALPFSGIHGGVEFEC